MFFSTRYLTAYLFEVVTAIDLGAGFVVVVVGLLAVVVVVASVFSQQNLRGCLQTKKLFSAFPIMLLSSRLSVSLLC